MKKRESAEEVLLGIVASIIGMLVSAGLSFIPTWLWFCFDDALAGVVGEPWVGELGFWNVYPFIWFWASLAPYQSPIRAARNHVVSKIQD